MSKKEQLLVALRDAGRRGLSRQECIAVAGSAYSCRLLELEEDGHLLHRKHGRYRTAWFRVILTLEAQPEPAEPEQQQLLDVSGAEPPANALLGDIAA